MYRTNKSRVLEPYMAFNTTYMYANLANKNERMCYYDISPNVT